MNKIIEENLAFKVSDVSHVMRHSCDVRAQSIGVTRAQQQVLSVLHRNGGINQSGLAEILKLEPITVYCMVDRLQEANLVQRRSDPADRRSWRLFLTDRAYGLLGLFRPLADHLIEQVFEGVGNVNRMLLQLTLDRIRRNLLRRILESTISLG